MQISQQLTTVFVCKYSIYWPLTTKGGRDPTTKREIERGDWLSDKQKNKFENDILLEWEFKITKI